jgi:multiple RNA-binding domain-containing protein 1
MSAGKGAGEGAEPEEKKKRSKTGLSSTKMIIRNVAFEATKKDLATLFKPFGQVLSHNHAITVVS